MSFRLAINSTRPVFARPLPRLPSATRAYSTPSAVHPVKQFFAHGIPIECYPIIGVTVCVLSFATFSISRHVLQDRDHLRWLPGGGGVAYVPSQ